VRRIYCDLCGEEFQVEWPLRWNKSNLGRGSPDQKFSIQVLARKEVLLPHGTSIWKDADICPGCVVKVLQDEPEWSTDGLGFSHPKNKAAAEEMRMRYHDCEE
jgi:hypothetical protein